MGYNYNGAQSTADRMITKFGAKTFLRRAGVNRAIKAVETDQFARDENGQYLNPLSKIVIMSAKNVDDPPDWQLDSWVDFNGKVRRMTARQTALAPAGIAVYFQLTVIA